MRPRPIEQVITVDGPAGAGKSTVSRRLARELGCLYLDTGAMYRAAAVAARRCGLEGADGESLGALCRRLELTWRTDQDPPRLLLKGEDITRAIRHPEMDMLASRISALRPVREAMVRLQRRMARGRCVVAEGRDMGTVVFPGAGCKFFLTATAAVRARRRYEERRARGEAVLPEQVAAELEQRDLQDRTRSVAPLKPAAEAIVIDSTHMDVDEVVLAMKNHVVRKCASEETRR